jgi:alpha-D-xyloside xylohydrolase
VPACSTRTRSYTPWAWTSGYEGLRAAAPDKRVVILTRSGFAGMQRYAAASWSGDISSTWTAMRKQIAAGLGFALSGMPYWTFDTGGFSVPDRFAHAPRGSAALEEWRELATRWFELAAFVPILRVHGQAPKREMWEFGGDGSPAYQAMLKFDRLRYRLLPYVYALATAVTREGGTIMRPLAMDFPTAGTVDDQFMFGPALMVSPVTTYQARDRTVVLPATAGGWYDFWTGAAVAVQPGHVAAPFDAIPVHVRAGAIIPFGPELQYTDEKPPDPITLYVYAGSDGAFTLYEDDGVSNDYEKGAFATIPIRWQDATRTLTIGKRAGAFPGMLARRTFQIVLVRRDRPVPFSLSPKPEKTVGYAGEAVALKL